MKEKNVAYDFSLFEVEPQPKDNVIELPKQNNKKRFRSKFLNMAFACFSVVIGVSVVSTIVYGQAKLTELTEEINTVSKCLDESQSIHTQLEMKVESQLSLKSVEDCAKAQLEMKRTSPCQVEYISLSDGDKAELDLDSKKANVVDRLKDIFLKLK